MSDYQNNSYSVAGTTAAAGSSWAIGLNAVRDVQKAFVTETMLSANEAMDRFRVEAHLANEFLSKMAGAHSVKDLGTIWEECGRHQIEFARRESDRFFGHGARLLDTAETIIKNRAPGKLEVE
jgi:hypothetical protein